MNITLAIGLAVAVAPQLASAEVRITELMYEGTGLPSYEYRANGTVNDKIIDDKREFFEITNLGDSAVDLDGWYYNDNNVNDPVAFGSAVGQLAAGESLVLTEMNVADFRTAWGLADTVKVFSIGGRSNMGKGDTLNIYAGDGSVIDSVTYDTSFTPASGTSYNRPFPGTLTSATADDWLRSVVGDAYGSHLTNDLPLKSYGVLEADGITIHEAFETTPRHDLGNPGFYAVATVPEPGGWAMLLAGIGLIGATARRRA
ncbi:lamin tail domain-containing protein [Methyloversatilis sp.]|uniref:lamin tail domain-containing protein n=1 Tax=Methyloversatilis sp. TaxID=2569862 RepID=UPI0035B4C2BD